MGFSEMRGGMTMFQTVYLKIRILVVELLIVYKQTIKLGLGDRIY